MAHMPESRAPYDNDNLSFCHDVALVLSLHTYAGGESV